MVRQILRKELLVNLLSLRFLIGLVVCALLMGIVGDILVDDFAARQQAYLSRVEAHRQALAKTKVYGMVKTVVDIPPSPLSVFSRAARDLPSSVEVSPFHIPSLLDEGGGSSSISLAATGDSPFNPLLRIFNAIDLCFVISMIMSLFAVLLVFDSFSGERESGTLRLLLSSPAGRANLLAGKYLGALLTLAIPLTIGLLEVMLLWLIHPGLRFDASAWAGAGLIGLASLVFLSAFLSGALFLSLFARESSTSLMYLLFGWVFVTIVVPTGGSYVAEFFRPGAILEQMAEGARQQREEFIRAYLALDYRQKSGWNNASTDLFGAESLLGITEEEVYNRLAFNEKLVPMKLRYAEQRYREAEAYALTLRDWSRVRDDIIRPSPSTMYTRVVQAIAGTDIATFDDVVARARLYRSAMMSYLAPKMNTPAWFTRALEYPDVQPTEQNNRYWQQLIGKEGERAVEKILSWDRIAPLDLSGMPPAVITIPDAAERAAHALTDGVLLLVGTPLFLGLALIRIARYPVT